MQLFLLGNNQDCGMLPDSSGNICSSSVKFPESYILEPAVWAWQFHELCSSLHCQEYFLGVAKILHGFQ